MHISDSSVGEDLDFCKEDLRGIKRQGSCSSICAVVQANLEGEKEIYLVSSLPYIVMLIVLFIVAQCYFGFDKGFRY
jgi:hypothetical protein